MSSEPKEFLVLSRGHWDPKASPEDIQGAIDRFYVWHDLLVSQGRMKTGQRLTRDGKVVAMNIVTDGPFTEAKEIVGGYWFMLAASLDEAAQWLMQNPCLEYGLRMEVRPVLTETCSAYDVTCETPPERLGR
ncbi:MAG: YciI family protein [Steroidobacteraceae bacterium]